MWKPRAVTMLSREPQLHQWVVLLLSVPQRLAKTLIMANLIALKSTWRNYHEDMLRAIHRRAWGQNLPWLYERHQVARTRALRPKRLRLRHQMLVAWLWQRVANWSQLLRIWLRIPTQQVFLTGRQSSQSMFLDNRPSNRSTQYQLPNKWTQIG